MACGHRETLPPHDLPFEIALKQNSLSYMFPVETSDVKVCAGVQPSA
jgi:hypothetical protein